MQVPQGGQHTAAIWPRKLPRGAGRRAVAGRGKSVLLPGSHTHTHTTPPPPWPRTGKREIGVAPRTATEQGPKELGRCVSSSVGWTGQLPPPEGWHPGSKAGTQAPVCLTVARPPALVLTRLRGISCGTPTGCQASLSPYAQTPLPLRSLQGPQSRPPATDLPCVCARLPGLWSPC